LAWTLAHATLLESLSAVLQESLMPIGWNPTAAGSELVAGLALGFAARADDDRTTAGVLGASCATVTRLAAAAESPSAAAVHSWAARLQGEIHVVLRTTSFPWRELLAAREGDVLALGRRTRCWRNVLLIHTSGHEDNAPSSDWSASYDGERRLEICDARLEDLAEVVMSEPMTDELDTKAANTHALENLPVVLDFDVGTLRVPLAELALLKPGYVFQLPGRLENAQVVIRANGKRIGRGELVAVGDMLGVQLLVIDADGLR
jgi:type III secretion protein Q